MLGGFYILQELQMTRGMVKSAGSLAYTNLYDLQQRVTLTEGKSELTDGEAALCKSVLLPNPGAISSVHL